MPPKKKGAAKKGGAKSKVNKSKDKE